jgi:chemotaxis methyl-accepting protein methylase
MPDVMGTLRDQMRASGIAAERDYYGRLASEPEGGPEWDALIERLTNHETSFFRHPPSFDALRASILPEVRERRAAGSRISIWSAGCSTGQEAYSLAMLAADTAASAPDFMVWGSDISQAAINVARRGRYGHRAVATVPAGYRERFLRSASDDAMEFDVVDDVRERVRFRTTNLVEPAGFHPSHDIILCHNVLIYFSPAAVTRAVNWLASCLTLGGFLLLGPGEAPNERPPGLETISVNGVRVFRRRRARNAEVKP